MIIMNPQCLLTFFKFRNYALLETTMVRDNLKLVLAYGVLGGTEYFEFCSLH
uniref:Uncharacterized protein n=1 Tax=Anguilla anguilla TaxID=7936 RepID=A0A0E9W0H8_ANGAN